MTISSGLRLSSEGALSLPELESPFPFANNSLFDFNSFEIKAVKESNPPKKLDQPFLSSLSSLLEIKIKII